MRSLDEIKRIATNAKRGARLVREATDPPQVVVSTQYEAQIHELAECVEILCELIVALAQRQAHRGELRGET